VSQTQDVGREPRVATVPILIWLGLQCSYRIDRLVFGSDPPFPSAVVTAFGVAVIVILCGLQLPIVLRRVSRRRAVWILAAQAILTYVPYVVVGGAWGPVSALLMAALLLTFTGWVPWLLAVLIVTSEFVIRAIFLPEAGSYVAIWAVLTTTAAGLSCFAIVRLADLVRELQATRVQLAPLEVARERLRIARSLRAVLGAHLIMIIRAGREARADLDRAYVAEVVAVGRRSLAEVRSIADDYRDRSLTAEVEAAGSVLAAAGVPVSIDASPVRLPGRVDAALAAVVRRTVIAALRNGTPEHCRIELDGSARLRVSFAGLAVAPLREALEDAAEEIADLGGRLDVGTWVEARIPVGRRPRAARARGPVGTAPWLAWAVLLVLEIDHASTTALNMLWSHDLTTVRYEPLKVVLAAIALPLIGVLQLHHVRPRKDGSPPRAWQWTLSLQVALVLTAIAVEGEDLPTPYAGLVAGVILFHVRPVWSWGMAALLVFASPLLYGPHFPFGTYLISISLSLCMMVTVYMLCRLPVVVQQLAEARRELARMAVLQERLRISRDVHDLLGFQLSAIVVKGEFIARLVATDPLAARGHLAEVVATAEQALAAVRSITQEPTGFCLTEEAETARSMLCAAGIETRIDLVSTDAGSLLAIVLREAVTNVVRHAHARVCEIDTTLAAGSVRLRVSNDGALAEATGRRGTGLANLRSRVEEAGGRLTVRREDDRFTLIAELPAPPLNDHLGEAMAVA
jgi:signal transduction histidine kinase